jgi:hypothetical protein
MRKHLRLITLISLIFVSVVVAGFAALSWSRKIAERKRDFGYLSALQHYRSDLHSAATRGDVESYLQSRRIQFGPLRCVDDEPNGSSDFVLIGTEDAPSYCSENNVYIAFQFDTYPSGSRANSDRLKGITIDHKLDDCL